MSKVADEGWDEGDYHKIDFDVGRSRRYHSKMTQFYQSLHDVTVAFNAVLSTGAFVALFGLKAGGAAIVPGSELTLAKWLTGGVAAASALDAALGFSRKARTHATLARRFTDLAARMIQKPANPATLRWARAERVMIERDEPPVKRLIDLVAQNEEARSRGSDPMYQINLSRWQRVTGYVFTTGMKRLEREDNQRQKKRREMEAAEAQSGGEKDSSTS